MKLLQRKGPNGSTYLIPEGSTEPHVIQFEKIERDCPYNRENPAHKIYDYKVIDKGEHVATFSKWSGSGRKYALADINGAEIRSQGYIDFMAYGLAKLNAVYAKAKASGLIPTAEEIEEREMAQAAKELADRRKGYINGAASESFEALKQLAAMVRKGSYILAATDHAEALIARVEASAQNQLQREADAQLKHAGLPVEGAYEGATCDEAIDGGSSPMPSSGFKLYPMDDGRYELHYISNFNTGDGWDSDAQELGVFNTVRAGITAAKKFKEAVA